MEPDTMRPQPTTGEAGEEYKTSPDRALRDLKERIRREALLRWADQTNDGEPDVMGEAVVTEPQEALKTGTSSGRREATRRRSPEYERREAMADRHRDDWRESSRASYWRVRDRDRAPPRRVFDPQTGESHPLPYESKDRYIITHKASEPPTFRGYGITKYLEKWELHASRSQWSEEEIIENFLFNVDPSLGKEVKEDRPKDGKWTTYKKNLVELYKLEDNKYSIQDLETMTQDGDESVWAFGMCFQKISYVLMKKGKISEVERCTIFIGHLSKGRQKSILRDLSRNKLDFPEVLKLAIKAEADDYKDLVWRGMRRRDFSLYKEYTTDRCPDFKDYSWSEKNEAVAEEVKEIRDIVKGLTRQVTKIVTTTGATAYRDKSGGSYSLRWDRRNTDSWRSVEDRNPRTLTDYCARERERDDEPWRRRDDEIDRDCRTRETYGRARRLDDYSRSPRYEPDGGRGDSRGRWESDQDRRDGFRDGRYARSDRDGHRDDIYERSDRDGHKDDKYERMDRDGYRGGKYERGDRPDDSRGRYDRDDRRDDSPRGTTEETDVMIHVGGTTEETGVMIHAGDTTEETDVMIHAGDTTEETDAMIHAGDTNTETAVMICATGMREGDMALRLIHDRPPTPRNSCVYCRGDDHIKRDCPDLKRAIDEGLVVLDDRKYVKWADDLGDVSMFPSMKENVEARRVKPSKGKKSVRSQSIKITFEGDMATTPIRVATTKSARGSTSKKTDTDNVMAEKDGQRIEGEEVIVSPRKRGVKKFLMKSSLNEIDTVEPLRRALRQPILDARGKERPLRFESRTLNAAERNYSQFKKEVLAVLRCLDTFRHYIYGRRFILRVDPTAVASVLEKDFSLTDPTIARWIIRIRLYDYTVERISGTKNVVADGLSRIPLEGERSILAEALTMAETRRAERFLVNLYEGKYRMIGLHLTGQESQDSDIRRQAAKYCLRAGHLFRRPVGSGMPLRVVCNPEERQTIVAELHDGVVGGHRGVRGTYEKVRRLYWWEGQYKDVERHCMTCEECQKRALVKYKEPLQPSYPTRPGEKVHIDLVKMPKGVGNMNYVVNIRDDFTGFMDRRPIRSKTTKEVKNFVLEYLSRYGCVSKIVMDRGAEFLADEVQSVFKRAGARVSIATAYHPQSNSPVERGHQTLIASLSKWCKGKDSDWPRYFRYAIWADNVTVRASTGYPPYTLRFGRHCPLPIEFHVDSWTTVDWTEEMSR
ncbi:hypothetical protein CBR_g44299 [Chara braunii]|uniref:Integrase catalytic domain-containing protein n=1 Tax=Chara braunii TaxID=69332 RepID=A0A388K321_CHABU|nr:hypothetical protein CBR_g44299 [Chara braunii]|eukprot:GBG64415.1 hypothetical protein CBR_g44299 [Chara braunii]